MARYDCDCDYDFDSSDEQESISEYLTPKEVMDLLYIGKNMLYKLLGPGELKGFRIGRQWRISRKSLQAFCEKE